MGRSTVECQCGFSLMHDITPIQSAHCSQTKPITLWCIWLKKPNQNKPKQEHIAFHQLFSLWQTAERLYVHKWKGKCLNSDENFERWNSSLLFTTSFLWEEKKSFSLFLPHILIHWKPGMRRILKNFCSNMEMKPYRYFENAILKKNFKLILSFF